MCCLIFLVQVENLLLTSDGAIKLCDFGSATINQLYPDGSWTSVQRGLAEDEVCGGGGGGGGGWQGERGEERERERGGAESERSLYCQHKPASSHMHTMTAVKSSYVPLTHTHRYLYTNAVQSTPVLV